MQIASDLVGIAVRNPDKHTPSWAVSHGASIANHQGMQIKANPTTLQSTAASEVRDPKRDLRDAGTAEAIARSGEMAEIFAGEFDGSQMSSGLEGMEALGSLSDSAGEPKTGLGGLPSVGDMGDGNASMEDPFGLLGSTNQPHTDPAAGLMQEGFAGVTIGINSDGDFTVGASAGAHREMGAAPTDMGSDFGGVFIAPASGRVEMFGASTGHPPEQTDTQGSAPKKSAEEQAPTTETSTTATPSSGKSGTTDKTDKNDKTDEAPKNADAATSEGSAAESAGGDFGPAMSQADQARLLEQRGGGQSGDVHAPTGGHSRPTDESQESSEVEIPSDNGLTDPPDASATVPGGGRNLVRKNDLLARPIEEAPSDVVGTTAPPRGGPDVS